MQIDCSDCCFGSVVVVPLNLAGIERLSALVVAVEMSSETGKSWSGLVVSFRLMRANSWIVVCVCCRPACVEAPCLVEFVVVVTAPLVVL